MPKLIQLFFFCFFFSAMTAEAADAGKPAFLTHAYFCNEAVTIDDTIQPDMLLYEARSNYPGVSVTFVMTLLLEKGKHDVSVKIFGPDGKTITTTEFATLEIERNHSIEVLKSTINGRLPTGGLKYVVASRFNDSKKAIGLGEFILRTVKQ